MYSRLLRVTVALLALALVAPSAPLAAQAACTFTLGFKALGDQIPEIAGDCLENEHFEASTGNALQRTAGGLLVWRKLDNWTVFTNGVTTWINGPYGLASRPNAGPTFEWEAAPSAAPAPAVAPQVAPALVPALNTLYGVEQQGPQFAEWVRQTAVSIGVGGLPEGVNGAYNPSDNSITISQGIVAEDVRAIAPVLAHEITHAVQTAEGQGGDRDCVRMEVKAYMLQAGVWATFWNGSGPARTALERHHNRVLQIVLTQGEPGLYAVVVSEPGYQYECNLWVPPGASPSSAAPPASGDVDPALASRCNAIAAYMVTYWAGRYPIDVKKIAEALRGLCLRAAIEGGARAVDCFEWAYWKMLREYLGRTPDAVKIAEGLYHGCVAAH